MRFSRTARAPFWALVGALATTACGNGSGPGLTLAVTPDSVQLVRNDSLQLSVSALRDGQLVTGVAVSFTSADTSIVTVTNVGWVRAKVKLGRTTVHVSGGGAQRDIPVVVFVPPAFIIVGPNDTLVAPGQTVQMRASIFDANSIPITGVTPTWESTAPTWVSVSAMGLARADSAGREAFITARLGSVSGSARVRVRGPVAIMVSPADTTIAQGDSAQFRAKVVDQGGDSVPGVSVTWDTDNPLLIALSATGRARTIAGRSGRATIRAHYGAIVGTAGLTVNDTSILGNRVTLGGGAYGAAISANDVAYITLVGANQLARTQLPSQAFTPAVNTGSVPTEVAFNSTGTVAYVTNQFSRNVGVVDVASNSQIDLIPVTGDPFEVIVAPGDSIIYVSTNVNQVYGIRLSSKAVVTSFPTPAIGNGMLIRDTLLYVSTHSGGTIVEFNLRTRAVSRTLTVGGTPQKLAISPDGNTLYIANQAGYVQFWNRITGAQIGANIQLPGSNAYGIALRPTTGKLYVTTAYFGGGGIYIIDPALHAITNGVIAGGSTRRVVFDANGVGFVPNEDGWVDFIK